MKKKIITIILAASFVVLIAGASLLYGRLRQEQAPEQLAPLVDLKNNLPKEENDKDVNNENGKKEGEQEKTAERQEPKAMDFTVYDGEENQVKLSDYFGKPIVLNFWASWCGPCQSEMPDFQEKYLELNDTVQFLMVNVTGGRETVATAKSFISQNGYTFPVFYDSDLNAADTYEVYSLPTTYFIDADGYLMAQATGAISAATLQSGIDMIMG